MGGEEVQAVRRRFFESGRGPKQTVPEYIARSWERSAQFGVGDGADARVEPLTDGELRIELDKHGRLCRQCTAELDVLRSVAASSDSLATLSSPDGLILASVGADHFSRRARGVALCPGSPWSERVRGTNGIGAVLVERRPLSVRGAEHFLESNRFLTCSAAPIMTPYGAIAGVLNVSAPTSTVAPHTLGLVALAVDQIEHRFFVNDFDECQVVRLHSEKDLLGTAREGILVFDGSKLVAANRHGLALMNLDWAILGLRRFEDLFETAVRGSRDGVLRDHNGRTLHCEVNAAHSSPTAAPPSPYPRQTSRAVSSRADPIYDDAMLREIERARRVVDAGLPVIVTGETGTGKEMLARYLHARSARANRPFVAVNCAALPEGLIESELFGYAEGAFTGARKSGSIGLLREAHSGFLFLDEIGDMPLGLQARLLRVLQEREVTPLGSARPVPVDFALICATHCDLQESVARGVFRQDLFYRIAQFHIRLAPLHQAKDLAKIVSELWASVTHADPSYALEPATIQRLAAYEWPGNYRQLTSVLRTLAALAEPHAPVTPDVLPEEIRERSSVSREADLLSPPEDLDGFTRNIMQATIDRHNGNVSAAARSLGVNRSTLYRRLKMDHRVP